MRISHDPGNAGKPRDVFGSALRVAPGNENARGGVRAMYFPHGIARLRIGGGGYGAGVEHHDVGGGVLIEHGPSSAAQGAAHRRSICFGGATAKIFEREGGHELRADSTRGACREKIIAAK